MLGSQSEFLTWVLERPAASYLKFVWKYLYRITMINCHIRKSFLGREKIRIDSTWGFLWSSCFSNYNHNACSRHHRSNEMICLWNHKARRGVSQLDASCTWSKDLSSINSMDNYCNKAVGLEYCCDQDDPGNIGEARGGFVLAFPSVRKKLLF